MSLDQVHYETLSTATSLLHREMGLLSKQSFSAPELKLTHYELEVLTLNPSHFYINTKAAIKIRKVKISIWILQGTLDQIRM